MTFDLWGAMGPSMAASSNPASPRALRGPGSRQGQQLGIRQDSEKSDDRASCRRPSRSYFPTTSPARTYTHTTTTRQEDIANLGSRENRSGCRCRVGAEAQLLLEHGAHSREGVGVEAVLHEFQAVKSGIPAFRSAVVMAVHLSHLE